MNIYLVNDSTKKLLKKTLKLALRIKILHPESIHFSTCPGILIRSRWNGRAVTYTKLLVYGIGQCMHRITLQEKGHYLIKQYIGHFEAQSSIQYRPFSADCWDLLFEPLIRTLGNQAILNEVSNIFGGTENENIRKNLKFTQFHIDKNACPLGNVLNLQTNVEF